MKIDIDSLEETYDKCIATGNIKEKAEIDTELIRSIKKVALTGLEFIKKQTTGLSKESTDWTFVFREHYESLRGLIEAYLLFDMIKADSHQCKNAYLCLKHPELDLDWNFLETIRLKRNAVNYRGQLLKYTDWKLFEMKFTLHINKISEEIENKIKNETN